MTSSSKDGTPSREILDRVRRALGGSGRQRLGRLATERGWVSETDVEEALRAQAAGSSRRIGELLASFGRLTPEQVHELLQEQGRRVLDALGPERSAAPPPEVASFASTPDRCVDAYILVEPAGRGGLSEVWKAWDRELGRWVAIKKLNVEGKEATARFLSEAKFAAQVEHPNIVAIYGTGEHEGTPYIVMQYVEQSGAAVRAVDPPEAARRILEAARAVHHAHEHGIIHRDLKPANLLVARDGRIMVGDFGLARQVEAPPGTTFPGMILGTPAYMSPEQARGDMSRVGPASDVFSLGASLYEYLTGAPPYEGRTSNETLVEAIRCTPVPARSRNPEIPRDLAAILRKTMEQDPEKRYGSAKALAEDLARFLEHRPVSAVKRPPWVRGVAAGILIAAALIAAWFGAANSDPVELKSINLLTLIDPARHTMLGDARIENGRLVCAATPERSCQVQVPYHPPPAYDLMLKVERIDGSDSLHIGVVCGGVQTAVLLDGYPGRGGMSGLHVLDGKGAERNATTRGGTVFRNGVTSTVFIAIRERSIRVDVDGKTVIDWEGDPARLSRSPSISVPDMQAIFLAAWSQSRYRIHAFTLHPPTSRASPQRGETASNTEMAWTAPSAEAMVVRLAFSPDGRRLASSTVNGKVQVWDARSGNVERLLEGHPRDWVKGLSWSPDSESLITGSHHDLNIRFWDPASGAEKSRLPTPHVESISSLAIDPTGMWIASGGGARCNRVFLWNLETRSLERTYSGHGDFIIRMAFDPKGRFLATTSSDGTLRAWNLPDGGERWIHQLDDRFGGNALAIDPRGRWIISQSVKGDLSLHDPSTGEVLRSMTGHDNLIVEAAFLPGDNKAVSLSFDRTVRIWDIETGRSLKVLAGHARLSRALALSPDGTFMATAGRDGIRVLRIAPTDK